MKTKALIRFAVTAKLICAFVFAYAEIRFSHDAAHFILKIETFRFIAQVISISSRLKKNCLCDRENQSTVCFLDRKQRFMCTLRKFAHAMYGDCFGCKNELFY